jgi:hypothetical protein
VLVGVRQSMLCVHSRGTLEKAWLSKMNDGSTRLQDDKDALMMQISGEQYDKPLRTPRSRKHKNVSFLNAHCLPSQSLSTFPECKCRC